MEIPAVTLSGRTPAAITAHLERLVVTGRLSAGTKLPPERELASQFGVSRSTLREAMLALEHKHLIERVQGRGTIVLDPPREAWDLRAMTASTAPEYVAELRYALEPEIARLAALRATESDLMQLRDVMSRTSEDLSVEDSMAVDIEFHLQLARTARNPLMEALVGLTSEWTRSERASTHSDAHWRRLSAHWHAVVLDAVSNRDASAARLAMSDHLADVQQRIFEARAEAEAAPPDAADL